MLCVYIYIHLQYCSIWIDKYIRILAESCYLSPFASMVVAQVYMEKNIQLKTSPGFVVQQATYSFKCHDDVSVYHHFVWISPNSFLVLKRDVKTRLYRTRCRDWTHLGTIHSYILSYLHESMGISGSSNGGTVPYKAIFGGAYPLT